MFVFVGGIGPKESGAKDVVDKPCPACETYALKERRVDQVGAASSITQQSLLFKAEVSLLLVLPGAPPIAGAVTFLHSCFHRPRGQALSSMQCLWVGLQTR